MSESETPPRAQRLASFFPISCERCAFRISRVCPWYDDTSPKTTNRYTRTQSLRTPACERQNSSYRYTFAIVPGRWTPMRVPWSAFEGHGPGPDVTPFVPSLRRLGVVSIGEAKEVVLAVGKVGFYNVI